MSTSVNYNKLNENDILFFNHLLGEANVYLPANEKYDAYTHDETEDLRFYPEVILLPETPEQISKILNYANQKKIAVTPRGAGTGLSGGALAVQGGIILATQRLNKIIQIDERNLQAIVEPGVINEVFKNAVAEKGLFYPPDPASKGSCFLGGNLAECSGGPKAVKYGVTRDYVLNLEVVLPTGEIIWTGANTLKNSTGYNLTQLMIGSEGTLGIITKVVFKLLPLPTQNMVMLVPFYSAEDACKAVSEVFKAGITPSAMEFMERDAIDWALKYVDNLNIVIEESIQAHLLIEVDGNNPDIMMGELEKIAEVVSHFKVGELLIADSEAQKENLWKMRRCVAEAVKANSIYKEEDTVVPRAELPILLKGVKGIGKKYGFKSVCYGHAGDGNLHVNIIKSNLSDDAWNNDLPKGIREIFILCKSLGGTISGEHGIGYVQKKYLDIVFNKTMIDLQKGIKKLFDPNLILNPSKIFPD
ncbi:MAG: FAD-binding protein [Bacteroidia bacterium]|nr:FAD-binding protein [Bacteroidia bacterium]